jgi:DNA-directed RNA polymerase subunit RPC12/RpoP
VNPTEQRRREEGLCARCGGDSDGHYRCIDCTREMAEAYRARTGGRAYTCSRCGGKGHNIRSCMEEICR